MSHIVEVDSDGLLCEELCTFNTNLGVLLRYRPGLSRSFQIDLINATLLFRLIDLSRDDLFERDRLDSLAADHFLKLLDLIFHSNLDWCEHNLFHQHRILVIFAHQYASLLWLLNCKGCLQKLLRGLIAEHDTFGGLGEDKETFVHAVEQPDILQIISFNSVVQLTDVLYDQGKHGCQ